MGCNRAVWQRPEGGMNMSFVFEHSVLGFCWWDLPALIVLILVVVAFIWKHHDMKKQERELEDQISELYADDTVKLDSRT